MPGVFAIIINSIALFYLLPFISVGVYTIGTQKYSLANFLLFFGGVTALHSSFRPSNLSKISWRIYHLDGSLGTHSVRVILEQPARKTV